MKIYGKTKVIGTVDGGAYLEVNYKEYRADGSIKQTGTEDFSAKRWSSIPYRFVYTWDGQRRNKGGRRWFDFEGMIRIDDPRAYKRLTKVLFPDAEIVEVRTR